MAPEVSFTVPMMEPKVDWLKAEEALRQTNKQIAAYFLNNMLLPPESDQLRLTTECYQRM
jgi:hypothetical protein